MFRKWGLSPNLLFAGQHKMWLSMKVMWTLDNIVIAIRMGCSFQISALPTPVCFFFFSCVATAGCGWLPYYTLAVSLRTPPGRRCFKSFCIHSLGTEWIGIFPLGHAEVTRIISLSCNSWKTGVSRGRSSSGELYSRQDKTKLEKQERVKKKKRAAPEWGIGEVTSVCLFQLQTEIMSGEWMSEAALSTFCV